MCGLVFLFNKNYSEQERLSRTKNALSKIVHRGPDAEGIYACDSTVVGHRRLSIIDLDASKQPMLDTNKRYVMSYNGEIYNYKALRATLENKWSFQTNGDTEVLLAGLVTMGPQFLAKAEGMWAFVLWDIKEKRLVFARDRIGKKPLYYKLLRAGLACASELNALKELDDQPWYEDENSTADFFRYGYYLPGTTAYRDIKEVLPGHYNTWTPGKMAETNQYWSLSIGGFDGTKENAQKLLQEKLHTAIERRMVSDVEVGAFLSGGVDSSLLVSILTQDQKAKIKTFTIGFESSSYDERIYAQKIANSCQTDHYERILSEWDIESLKTLIFKHVGQPFADASLLPTSLVSELAAEHVKVALSGDGADELFSGYQRYQARVLMRWFTRLPKAIRKNLATIIRSIPEPMVHHSRSLIKKAHLFLDAETRFESELQYMAPLMLSKEDAIKLIPDIAILGHKAPVLPDETSLDDVTEMMAKDMLIYLPQDILLKVDRSSMAHSLETRAPFLDSELIQLAFSLPRSWHRRKFSGKRMLRSAFSEFLPKEIWGRRKQGFGVPLNQWFQHDLGEDLKSMLLKNDSVINTKFVNELLLEHRKQIRDRSMLLWAIYVYLLWKTQSKLLSP